MDFERLKTLAKSQGKSLTHLCKLIDRPKYYFHDLKKTGAAMPEEYLSIIAKELGTTPEYLLGETENPVPPSEQVREYLPYEKRGARPIIGMASAGLGVIAEEMILGWQSVDEEFDTEDFYWLQIAGNSMSPKIDDGDLVLVQKDAEINNGNIAVVVVDGTDGFIKQVEFDEDTITLHSFNPYYPDMVFEGAEKSRLRFIGRARKVERDL